LVLFGSCAAARRVNHEALVNAVANPMLRKAG
jgi:hypothetical protein